MERYHSTFCQGKLEIITGIFTMSGPQSVGENGVPEEVAEIFRKNPNVNTIAIQYNTDGRQSAVVYQRLVS